MSLTRFGAALAGALFITYALSILAACARHEEGRDAATPAEPSASHKFIITVGPERTSVMIGDKESPGFKVEGRIEPPLPSTVTAGIRSAVVSGCDGGNHEMSEDCVAGGANGAAFTLYLAQSCAPPPCSSFRVLYESNERPAQTYVITGELKR